MQQHVHVRELDGVRALAIGMVLFVHLFPIVPAPGAGRSLQSVLVAILGHGWLGVDLFFVLSGFLITGILLDARGRPGYFRTFYIRRFLRILPLYYTVLLVLIVVQHYGPYAAYWNFSLGFAANLAPLFGFDGPNSAGPFWSLAVEEQFYLFWPLVVLALPRRGLALAAGAIVVAEPFVRMMLGSDQLAASWCRFDGLALGALIAIWYAGPQRSLRSSLTLAAMLALGAVAIALLTAPLGGFGSGRLSVATRITEGVLVFGAAIVSAVALRGSRLTGPLRAAPLRALADWSFAIYLIHVPLVDAFGFIVGRAYPSFAALPPLVQMNVRAVCVVAAALAIAALSRRYLELPFLRLKTVLTPSMTPPPDTVTLRVPTLSKAAAER